MSSTTASSPSSRRPSFCLFSLSAGSGAVGQHSLIRKCEIIARRGFDAVELMNDDLVAFAESEEFGRIYRNVDLPSPSLSPESSSASHSSGQQTVGLAGQQQEEEVTFNALGPCSLNTLHREVAAAAFIGLLTNSLGIKVATLQPVRDVEGWTDKAQRAEAFRRVVSRFEICHALGTNMLFVCSNCQPVENLVASSEYANRAGADLAAVADLAAQWTPMEATARWRKHGFSDPIELIRRCFFRHYRPPTPLSPPESRAGSVWDDGHEIPVPTDRQLTPSHLSTLVSAAMRQTSSSSSASSTAPHAAIKIGYEALSWGTHVSLWREAWDVVRAADHPNVGIVLDSFNTVAREWADPCSPTGISQPEHEADERLSDSIENMGKVLSPEKIFFLQIADAKRVLPFPLPPSPSPTEPRPARMIWSRSHRLFPLEKEKGAFLPILDFVRKVDSIGYRGPWSVELFSDSIHERDLSVPVTHVDRGFRSLERLVEAVYGR